MTEPRTGAERYLARRLEDPEYRRAYEDVLTAARHTTTTKEQTMTTTPTPDLLRKAVDVFLFDIDTDHLPDETGRMCRTCGATDGSWPCVHRMALDDLKRTLRDLDGTAGPITCPTIDEQMETIRFVCASWGVTSDTNLQQYLLAEIRKAIQAGHTEMLRHLTLTMAHQVGVLDETIELAGYLYGVATFQFTEADFIDRSR